VTAALKIRTYDIYDIIKGYHWMVKEIDRLTDQLDETEFNGVAQYGIEAAMPKGGSVTPNGLDGEAQRRDKKRNRLFEYKYKVEFINERESRIKDEKERVILDCMLDGMTLTAIAKHMNISRTQVNHLQDEIVKKLGHEE
jgi:DNA-binding NarL/FixJ family response regulator